MTIANELMNLNLLFQNSLFRIPDYQRGYAWEKEQLEDFWEDLEHLEEDKNHYMGLLTLKPLTDKDKLQKVLTTDDIWQTGKGFHFKVYHVIDGQQRLTTAIILINQLIAHFRNNHQDKIYSVPLETIVNKYLYAVKMDATKAISCVFGYAPDDPSYDCLRFEIFKCAGKPSNNQKIETCYTKNLKKAADFFDKRIDQLHKREGIDGVADLYDKLVEHLKFNIHEINDELDEYISFETMNNRGKRLSNLELLKNRLIYLTTLFDDTYSDEERNDLRNKINRTWKEIYYWLGKPLKSRYVSDDDFLRQHWIIRYKIPARKSGELMDFFMKGIFSPKKLKQSKDGTKSEEQSDYDDIKDYVTSLHDFAEFYYYTYYPEDSALPDVDKRLLESLMPASGQLRLGQFRPLLMVVLYKDKNLVASDLDRHKFFVAMERLIFIHSLQKSTRSDFGGFSYAKAQNLYENKISLNEITKDLESRADSDANKSVKEFIDKLNESFDKKEGGYYKFREFLRHVLFEYECELADENGIKKIHDVKELFRSDWGDLVSVEHIFPQTSIDYWNKIFDFDEEKKYILKNSLGNLLLLSQKINASLQNFAYPVKVARYKNNSHSAIEVAQNQQWTAAEILNRSKKLVEFIDKRWTLKLTDAQKKSLIYLDLSD